MRLQSSMFLAMALVLSGGVLADFEEDYEAKQWHEIEVTLPTAPRADALLPFSVSATTSNSFFIDGRALSVGSDGVVRYALVVLSPEGGRNVSYEGIRCETRERRIYASGRGDGSWSKSRANEWVKIQDVSGNRHHAALFLDYFCPGGIAARDAEEVRDALRRGGHPESTGTGY